MKYLLLLLLLLSSCSILKNNGEHNHYKVCKKFCNCSPENCCVVGDFEFNPMLMFLANKKDTIWRHEIVIK